MGILKNIFSKKQYVVHSPLTGHAVDLSSVDDPVFAEGILGMGMAVIPEDGKLYAPVSGKIAALFPTGHALGLVDGNGMEILVHIGIDTVNLEGEGFETHVQVDQQVEAGQLLITFDVDKIREKGFDPVTMVVVSNAAQFGAMGKAEEGRLTANEALFWFG